MELLDHIIRSQNNFFESLMMIREVEEVKRLANTEGLKPREIALITENSFFV